MQNQIVEILIRRDGMTRKEAEQQLFRTERRTVDRLCMILNITLRLYRSKTRSNT